MLRQWAKFLMVRSLGEVDDSVRSDPEEELEG